MPENEIARVPKSRIVDLGSGKLPDTMTKDQYVELVYGCLLKSKEKQVLAYLSHRYNFKNKQPTTMSVRRAANDLDMTTNTFITAKKQLMNLGWISIQKGQYNNPDMITLLVGNERPNLKWKEPRHKEAQLEFDAQGQA